MRVLIIISLCVWATAGKAQSSSPLLQQTITWSVDSLKDIANNQTMLFSCQFKTMTTDKILWIQQNGSYTLEFTINSVSGTWPDINANGSLEYGVTQAGKTGTIKIESMNGRKTIAFSFTENGANTMPYIFEIVTFTQN